MLFSEVSDNSLTVIEGIILREFITWETRNIDQLIEAVYGHDENGGPVSANQTIKQYIWRVRKKLINGWTINNLRDHIFVLGRREWRRAR